MDNYHDPDFDNLNSDDDSETQVAECEATDEDAGTNGDRKSGG